MGRWLDVTTSPSEAWKEGGWVSVKVLHSLSNKIRVVMGIPQDWKLGLSVKLPKKGELGDCKNWRGIMLLTIASKVLSKFILLRRKNLLKNGSETNKQGFA